MKAYKISDVKAFMSKLLVQNTFDELLVSELVIQTFVRFEMNGTLNMDFYSSDEKEILAGQSHAKWSELKPFAYQAMKGTKTPLAFHITLMLSEKGRTHLIPQGEGVTGLYLHIKFEKKELYVVTGIARSTFSLDHSVDELWDEKVKQFLIKHQIEFE